ncbi:MAG: hypothetical protein MJA29_12500 [Candidatus Omnitrophica bacterium]|nr:hypothetical protein [Candidatus Omnitrophota bacterium]
MNHISAKAEKKLVNSAEVSTVYDLVVDPAGTIGIEAQKISSTEVGKTEDPMRGAQQTAVTTDTPVSVLKKFEYKYVHV